MQWPMFAFADNFGNVFIYNTQKNYMIQRIPMDPEMQRTDLRICKISISTNYTCYVLAYSELNFMLYQIDLKSYANMGLVEEFE